MDCPPGDIVTDFMFCNLVISMEVCTLSKMHIAELSPWWQGSPCWLLALTSQELIGRNLISQCSTGRSRKSLSTTRAFSAVVGIPSVLGNGCLHEGAGLASALQRVRRASCRGGGCCGTMRLWPLEWCARCQALQPPSAHCCRAPPVLEIRLLQLTTASSQ